MNLRELLDKVDIVDYISNYIELEQKGEEWWGLSCFKNEKTPSFSVRKTPPVFYDYSSGLGGNLYTFVKEYNHCTGKEAVEIIKKYVGYDGEIPLTREQMTATSVCKRFIPPKNSTKQSNMTTLAKDHMLKYENRRDKLAEWEKEGISYNTLNKFQVKYDGFSDRLVYPIKDMSGNIVNIGGRTLDPDWKEKNLRKYCYFYSWGALNTIYGLFENMEEIQKHHEVIIFEGCKSVLLADTWKIYNTAAILTSHLNPNQMKILAKLGCRVVFALDKDVNIKKDHNINRLKNYVNVEYIFDENNMLNTKDSPVDRGEQVFKMLYENRKRFR